MRQYVIASILIILGLLSLIIKTKLATSNNPINLYISDLPSTFLITGLLSLLFKLVQDKETMSSIRKLFKIHESIDVIGLKEIHSSSSNYNYENIIINSDTLSIVMNDGQRWVGNNIVALEKRFCKKSDLFIFLVHPESKFLDILAEKTNNDDTEGLKNKINSTVSRIKEAYEKSTKKGNVIIYGINKVFPTKSIFLTEDTLLETPYQTSSGRVTIPMYIYEKVSYQNSIYEFVAHDIEELKKESEKIWGTK
ncbi:MAG: hypothetical protein E7J15_06000 [Neisseria sp.]|nr:hypothetical protein [Neisseria sp.]